MKFLNENSITKFTTIIPPLTIIVITILITTIVINDKYKELEEETKYIRSSFIEQKKSILKDEIRKVKKFVEFRKELTASEDIGEIKKSILDYTMLVLSKDSGYVFVLDSNGNVLSHPTFKTGSNIWNIEDKTGLKLIQRIIQKATSNPDGGYTEYFWRKLGSTELDKKTTFSFYIKEWDWIVAMGAYMDDIENDIATKRLEAKNRINESINKIILIAVVVTIITIILSIFFARVTNSIFRNYKEKVETKEKKLKELNANLEFLIQGETQKRVEKEKELKAQHKDDLTGLANRTKLMFDIERSSEPKLVILNINNFKDINNYYGHKVGYEILKEIGTLVSEKIEGEEHIFFYKLFNDEFALLCKDNEYSREDFILIARDIKKIIEESSFCIDENCFSLTITAGLSFSKKDLYIHSDRALNFAKKLNKNYEVYDKDSNLEDIYRENINTTQMIKAAINDDRVILDRQCIMHNVSEVKNRYESLVRILSEDGEKIYPKEFLETARRSKLYEKITKIVLERSFNYYKDQSDYFSINIVIDDMLNKNTKEYIFKRLEDNRLKGRVTFEIIPKDIMLHYNDVVEFIEQVKRAGCKIALDNFGLECSNFDTILNLDLDYIKIDEALIQEIDKNESYRDIVKLIVKIAKERKIDTIAKFVHNESIFLAVKELGIDYSQGFYIHKTERFA